MKFITILLFCSITLIGCGTLDPIATPEIQHYAVQINSLNVTHCNYKTNLSLQILPTLAEAPYNSYNMYYSKNEYLLDSYSYSQWAVLPQNTVNQSIWQTAIDSCLFKNVFSTDVIVKPKYQLYSKIIKLQQTIRNNNSNMTFSVMVQLIDTEHNQIINSKFFNESSIIKTSPDGMVDGMSYDLQQFSKNLHNWLNSQKANIVN